MTDVADVTVCVPTIPPRSFLLRNAITSVQQQTRQPALVSVVVDDEGAGAAVTRNATVRCAEFSTEWLAFLDDDDEFLPHHLETLLDHQAATGADYVFSDFVVPQVPGFRLDSFCYDEFDPSAPLQTTITVLVRRTLWDAVDGYTSPDEMTRIHGDVVGEDYDFTKKCVTAGAMIRHVPVVTWKWNHHGGNTSGRKWNR